MSEPRREINDLPRDTEELKPEQAEQAEGGLLPAINVALGDGSVRQGDGSVRNFADGSVRFIGDGSV